MSFVLSCPVLSCPDQHDQHGHHDHHYHHNQHDHGDHEEVGGSSQGNWRLSDQMRAHCRVDPSDLTKRSVTHSATQSGQLKRKKTLKKANVNSRQRESKIILNSKRHDKIREIFSLSSQKYLFHIHFTPPLCRFPTIL